MSTKSKIWDVQNSDIETMSSTYAHDGYLLLDLGIEADLIDACAALTNGFLNKYFRVQDGYRNHPPLKALASHPKVLDLLEGLYGRRPFPFQTLNFPKGTQQGTHADSIFFDSDPAGFMCGLWIALEDIKADSGPLHYYPQSHNREVVTQAMINETHDGDLYARFRKEREGYEKHYALLKKGQAILWASNLLHGGDAIERKGSTRLSQVNHYYFEHCVYTAPTLANGNNRIVRLPYNISRRRFAWSIDDNTGRIVWPHWKQLVTTGLDVVLRRSLKYKV